MSNGSLDIGPLWELRKGPGPLIGVAIHAGHNLGPDVVPYLAIDEATRFREEDPYSDYWTLCCGTQLLTVRSRFEVDLNRPRSQAVYLSPQDAWGLEIWNAPLPEWLIAHAQEEHDRFYQELDKDLRHFEREYGRFVVFDLHSYNHRRAGPDAPPADPEGHPEVNVGTGTMDRERWASLIEGFLSDLGRFDFLGRRLDVRENVNFLGRYLGEFVHTRFPETGCVLSIEIKKFFMDEWSGLADARQTAAVLDALRSTTPGILEHLGAQ